MVIFQIADRDHKWAGENFLAGWDLILSSMRGSAQSLGLDQGSLKLAGFVVCY